MDIQHIKYFLAVVECESFSRAADKLYVTQPSSAVVSAIWRKSLVRL